MFRLLEWFFYDVLHLQHFPDAPCPHMKDRLSDLSDGTAKGISRWYAERHVAGCPGCSSRLSGLRLLRDRLLRLDTAPPAESGRAGGAPILSPERWNAITRSWEQIDAKLTNSGGPSR
jgi:hypothetical protein